MLSQKAQKMMDSLLLSCIDQYSAMKKQESTALLQQHCFCLYFIEWVDAYILIQKPENFIIKCLSHITQVDAVSKLGQNQFIPFTHFASCIISKGMSGDKGRKFKESMTLK